MTTMNHTDDAIHATTGRGRGTPGHRGPTPATRIVRPVDYDNYFHLFSAEAQRADRYTLGHQGWRTTARYRGTEVLLTCADTFELYRDGRPVGRGFDNGVNLTVTIDGRTWHADSLDRLLDRLYA